MRTIFTMTMHNRESNKKMTPQDDLEKIFFECRKNAQIVFNFALVNQKKYLKGV